jgi:hypothetical protein
MRNIIWLQIGFWVPAVVDIIMAFLILIPEQVGLTSYVYPMGLVSAIAFSWGIMLLIAARKPVERRWILVPTMFVILMIIVATALSLIINAVTFNQGIINIIIGGIVFSLVLFGYQQSRHLKTNHDSSIL